MKNITNLEININKTTNTLRFFSVLLVVSAVMFFLGASSTQKPLPFLYILLISSLLVSGFLLAIVSEIYWKMLKKFGATEERLMYFYNADKKIYE